MKTSEQLVADAFQRTEYDNGKVHECYEFSKEGLAALRDKWLKEVQGDQEPALNTI